MTLPPEILEGFKAEAASYLDDIRHTLAAAEADGVDATTFTLIHEKLDVVSGSAEMLELPGVVEATEPVLKHLANYNEEQTPAHDLLHEVEGLVEQVSQLLGVSAGGAPQTPEQPAPQPSSHLPDLPPDLIAIFQREAEDHQQVIQEGITHLKEVQDDTATMRDMRRAAHTLKGASASIGFKQLSSVSHLMEDILDEVIDGQHTLSDENIKLLDDIAYVIEEFISPTGTNIEHLLETIHTRAEGREAAPAPQQQAPAPADDAPLTTRGESVVRLPIKTIDRLIDNLGEVIINHGAFGEQMGSLRSLLVDFGATSQRLQRLADALDDQIERESLNLVTSARLNGAQEESEFDSIELDRYSAFYQLARELEEAATDARDINSQLDVVTQELNASLVRERRLASMIQEGLVNTKLMTFREILPRLERLVQHTADELGLVVEFIVTGEDTRVDKAILDALLEPLTHLLRNAIDHGLEDPSTRIDAGKPAHGTIKLNLTRDRGRLQVTLSDDGHGLDLASIRKRAEALGYVQPEDTPTDDEIINLIFADGFSTSATVTQTSGRGVGMNIVRRSIHHLQGTVKVHTNPGRGTTFTLSIPVSLAIMQALFFTCRGIGYAASLEQVSAVLRLEADALANVDFDGILTVEGKRYKALELGDFVDPDNQYSHVLPGAQQRYGLVVNLGDRDAAILVDGLAGIRDTVVKSLGNHLRRVHGVSGATISGDGQVSLILDLLEVASEKPSIPTAPPAHTRPTSREYLHVLVVDDSPSVRRVVGGFLQSVGWQVTLARDGLDALEKLNQKRPDVCLVDIEMPRMNGYELLGTIKEDATLGALPVVFLTSRSASKHRSRAEALGVDGYLVKPYGEEELVNTLKAVVRRVQA